jgi:hypothetical protein
MPDHSRVSRLAAGASDRSEADAALHLDGGHVHITVEAELPGAPITLRVLINTLRRMPGGLSIDDANLSPDEVRPLVDLALRLDPARGLTTTRDVPAGAAHLHIGLAPPTNEAIRICPDGYGAHLATGYGEIHQGRAPHPLGCVLAAAFGAAEAFKQNAPVVEARRVDHSHLTWCPVALSSDLSVAPMITEHLELDLALAGCGAIGTGIALILAEMDAGGDLLVMDFQAFGVENIATYSLGGQIDAARKRRKVDIVAEALTNYRVLKRDADLATLVEDVDRGRVRWPRTVLGALDSVPSRHAVQRLWPDQLIDAGTSDTAVGLHHVVASNGPCLMCFFPVGGGRSVVESLAHRTGLPLDLLGAGDQLLQPEHISHLDPAQRELLVRHIGKPVCNLARALGLVEGAEDFQAAVTFVAVQAACLAVGRLLAVELGLTLPNFVAYDTLIGPRSDALEFRHPIPTCYCQMKSARIRTVREKRSRLS